MMKKKTKPSDARKETGADKLKAAKLKAVDMPPPHTVIQNCNFTTRIWDGQALDAVNMVARGLLNLSELFQAQRITLSPMLVLNGPQPAMDTMPRTGHCSVGEPNGRGSGNYEYRHGGD